MEFSELVRPEGLGAEVLHGFVGSQEQAAITSETQDTDRVQWLDAHETYTNLRGLQIVQNHFTFAHKLSRGDQSPLERIPATVRLYKRTEQYIQSLASIFPSLASWKADELSFHLYDDEHVGLSKHRDNLRFIGVIAIASIDGSCDLVISSDDGSETALAVEPGDLCLLRAPGLINANQEIRPEHSVQHLRTPTRTSMMLRANTKPDEAIPGFRFNNWEPGLEAN